MCKYTPDKHNLLKNIGNSAVHCVTQKYRKENIPHIPHLQANDEDKWKSAVCVYEYYDT